MSYWISWQINHFHKFEKKPGCTECQFIEFNINWIIKNASMNQCVQFPPTCSKHNPGYSEVTSDILISEWNGSNYNLMPSVSLTESWYSGDFDVFVVLSPHNLWIYRGIVVDLIHHDDDVTPLKCIGLLSLNNHDYWRWISTRHPCRISDDINNRHCKNSTIWCH